jgi:DNA-binding NarL/FixJ family response regulator
MLAGAMSGHSSDGSEASSNGHVSRDDGPVRVLVADDHAIFRSSVVRALSVVPDVEVAGEVDSGDRACEVVVEIQPDVVLIDISMPGMDGFDATRRIRRTSPRTSVVLMSAFDGPQLERSAYAAGAAGIVTKGAPLDDVIGVILDAAARRA